MKTDIDISRWVYNLIKDSAVMESLSGRLSNRERPNSSTAEDVIISVLANEGASGVQQAVVNVNIYISDLWNDITKAWEMDTARVGEICELFKFLFVAFGDDFRISTQDSSQKVMANDVVYEDGHTEHFINNKLYIRISNY